jgi:carbonic anhydrase
MTILDSSKALERLLDGNRRFMAGQPAHPHQGADRRAELMCGQEPFAAILTCSDSRVPPEIIFDCGLGDLFVMRVAGNVLDKVLLGSIEYAAEHLGVRLVMVLGHSHCGAVTAAVEGGHPSGHIKSLTKRIRPAVQQAATSGGDAIDAAVTANVQLDVAKLRASQPILAHLIAEGKLLIVGARYELETGQVRLLDE